MYVWLSARPYERKDLKDGKTKFGVNTSYTCTQIKFISIYITMCVVANNVYLPDTLSNTNVFSRIKNSNDNNNNRKYIRLQY